MIGFAVRQLISIHAPSRERQLSHPYPGTQERFQSTLPHGSDPFFCFASQRRTYFNPRSLTGATITATIGANSKSDFNPRSLTGATPICDASSLFCQISIHAPSRERPDTIRQTVDGSSFQSTLPHGSDVLPE